MRTVRSFGLALFAATVIPALAGAQATKSAEKPGRGFEDSWYWGVKGGNTMFTSGESGATKINAATVGAEWLITRTRAALYISIEQAFFDTKASVFDPTSASSVRPVSISDLRRYNAGLFVFPLGHGSVRPYAGVGLAINVIQNAQPEGTYTSAEAQDAVFTAVDQMSSRTSTVYTLGIQAQVARAALFVQGSTMPTRNRFLINGAANTFMVEGGVRFNLLSAIEKLK